MVCWLGQTLSNKKVHVISKIYSYKCQTQARINTSSKEYHALEHFLKEKGKTTAIATLLHAGVIKNKYCALCSSPTIDNLKEVCSVLPHLILLHCMLLRNQIHLLCS